MPNHLADAASPYLRQHADNPIDWWPWGPQALAEARRRDVPLLISIGYSSCHWCHVMARETFSDPAVAELVNPRFVAIKVDREERPDVDQVYMTATQALTGQGGWPMTVFATPDGEPFFAGTYYPPQPRPGVPSFSQVCQAIADVWANRRDEVTGSARTIAASLQALAHAPAEPAGLDVSTCVQQVLAQADTRHGGFGDAPKFPQATLLDALCAYGGDEAIGVVQQSLEAMIRGGIHDQVGGGFHRYATDVDWQVPHFEKMLYDNALLLGTLTRCWRRTGPETGELRDHFEWAVRGIVAWLRREMLIGPASTEIANGGEATEGGLASGDGPTGGGGSGGDPNGKGPIGFAASLDADSPGPDGQMAEGAYYLWNPALLDEALGRDSRFVQGVCHVTMQGNMSGGLSTLLFDGDPAPLRFRALMEKLRLIRARRPAPARDDKRVAAWNALTLIGLVDAGMVFREPGWIDLARRTAEGLWTEHGFDGPNPVRTLLDGRPGAPAVAEDYGACALAFTRLAGALGDPVWLDRAEQVLGLARQRFGLPDGGFLDAAPDADLLLTPRQFTDEPTPSATSLLVAALRQVAALDERPELADMADVAAHGLYGAVAQNPQYAGWGLADLVVTQPDASVGPAQVVVVTPTPAGQVDELACAAWRLAPEGSAVVVGRPGTAGFGGLFDDRPCQDGRPTAYVCRGRTCSLPITDYSGLRTPLWGEA